VVDTDAGQVMRADCTDLAERFEALADGASADAETLDDLLKVNGLGTAINDPVNLTNRARQADQGSGAHEAIDDRNLPRLK
jgi:hypothetical protein